MAILCRDLHLKRFLVAKGNEQEALLVDGIEVYAIENLSELIDFLQGRKKLKPAKRENKISQNIKFNEDFADVQGQFLAKKGFRNSGSRWS